jgi:hypothetical protein
MEPRSFFGIPLRSGGLENIRRLLEAASGAFASESSASRKLTRRIGWVPTSRLPSYDRCRWHAVMGCSFRRYRVWASAAVWSQATGAHRSGSILPKQAPQNTSRPVGSTVSLAGAILRPDLLAASFPDRCGAGAVLGRILPHVEAACDLACGTGTTALNLARKGIRTYAVDLSPLMCRAARKKAARARPHCRFVFLLSRVCSTLLSASPRGYALRFATVAVTGSGRLLSSNQTLPMLGTRTPISRSAPIGAPAATFGHDFRQAGPAHISATPAPSRPRLRPAVFSGQRKRMPHAFTAPDSRIVQRDARRRPRV